MNDPAVERRLKLLRVVFELYCKHAIPTEKWDPLVADNDPVLLELAESPPALALEAAVISWAAHTDQQVVEAIAMKRAADQ